MPGTNQVSNEHNDSGQCVAQHRKIRENWYYQQLHPHRHLTFNTMRIYVSLLIRIFIIAINIEHGVLRYYIQIQECNVLR